VGDVFPDSDFSAFSADIDEKRFELNRAIAAKYDTLNDFDEEDNDEINRPLRGSDLAFYWEYPKDAISVCEADRIEKGIGEVPSIGEGNITAVPDNVYFSGLGSSEDSQDCLMLTTQEAYSAWNNSQNAIQDGSCVSNRDSIEGFNNVDIDGQGCQVTIGSNTFRVYREYFPQAPLACIAYNNESLDQDDREEIFSDYENILEQRGSDGSFDTKEQCEGGSDLALTDDDEETPPADDDDDEEPDPDEDNTEVPVNIDNEISYLDGNVCRYIPVNSSDWGPIVQSIPDSLNPDRNFQHEGEQYYLEGEAKSLFYCCLDNQESEYELETQLQMELEYDEVSDVGIRLTGSCSDMVDIRSDDIVSNFSGAEPLCPIIGGSGHNQEIDSIPLYTLSQSQIDAFSPETGYLLPNFITGIILEIYFPPDNQNLRLENERILIEEEGALPNVEPSLATLVLDGSVQYEGHDFFYLEDRQQCLDSSGSSSYFEDDLIENAYAQVESEIEVESISRSGRYRFFLDGDKIAERDISIDGENFEAKYFQDINNNQVKDPSEPFLDGFDENITIRLLEDIDVVGYDLDSGWNLIHLPLVNDDEDRIARASDLLSYWEGQNTTIYHIAIYENGRFNIFTSREGDINYDQDFELSPGQGMFVFNNGDRRQVTFPGRKLSEPLPLNLTSGWNLIGLASPSANYNSESLLNTINDDGINANILSRFDSGIYQSVVREDELIFGNNYNVIETEGYFLRVESNPGQFTP
jgi:hypothetical protein